MTKKYSAIDPSQNRYRVKIIPKFINGKSNQFHKGYIARFKNRQSALNYSKKMEKSKDMKGIYTYKHLGYYTPKKRKVIKRNRNPFNLSFRNGFRFF